VIQFSELKGKSISEIDGGPGYDFIAFHCSDGEKYVLNFFDQKQKGEVCGDLYKLIDNVIAEAVECRIDGSVTCDYYLIITDNDIVLIVRFD